MKIRNYFFWLIFLSGLTCGLPNPCLAKAKLAKTINCLNAQYKNFYKTKNADKRFEAASRYLKCFPSNFEEFEELMGYDYANNMAGPLNNNYSKYLNFLGDNYNYFDKKSFLMKFINIGISAHRVMSVDAEGELIAIVLFPFRENPDHPIATLSMHSKKKITRFWNFILSNLEGTGLDPAVYSCPERFAGTKACKILSGIKMKAPPYKAPC